MTDLYKQYRDIRGELAIPKQDLLKIDASSSSQQCSEFGLHPTLHHLQNLFNEKDALFVAGIGVLTKPVTKKDYVDATKTQLFAHDKSKYINCKSFR